MHRACGVTEGPGVYPDRAQVGRVSVLTKRQVSFHAMTLNLSSKQYVTCSFILSFFFAPPPDFLPVKGGGVKWW